MKIERVDSEIKRELSMLINYEAKDPRLEGAMISVLSVETTKDLNYAKVYIGIMNSENKAEILKTLQNSAGFFRSELFKRLRIRTVPELTFILDQSYEYGQKIEQIIKDLHRQ